MPTAPATSNEPRDAAAAALKRAAEETLATFESASKRAVESVRSKAAAALRDTAAVDSSSLDRIQGLLKEYKQHARKLQDDERDAAATTAEELHGRVRAVSEHALASISKLAKQGGAKHRARDAASDDGGLSDADDHDVDEPAPHKPPAKAARRA